MSHTYAAPGSYQARLTVTDNSGASASTTRTVTVVRPPGVVAADLFSRTTTNGWGSADTGGPWTVLQPGPFSDNATQGQVNLAGPTVSARALLDSVSAPDPNMLVDVSLNKVPTGDSVFAVLIRSGRSAPRSRPIPR